MLYIERDGEGALRRVEAEPFENMTGTLDAASDEARRWLAAQKDRHAQLVGLQGSDVEMVRVLEDLIEALVQRGVIRFTDLPEAARRKLDARAQVRAQLGGLGGLLGSEEEQGLI